MLYGSFFLILLVEGFIKCFRAVLFLLLFAYGFIEGFREVFLTSNGLRLY